MVDRRKFLKLGAASASASLVPVHIASAEDGAPMKRGGEAYSHLSGAKLKVIPASVGNAPAAALLLVTSMRAALSR